MASELSVDKITPINKNSVEITGISGTVTTGNRILGTDVGSISAPGMVIGTYAVQNSVRTNIADVSEYTIGTFKKQRADTAIMYQGLLMGHDQVDRDASGLYIAFSAPNVAKFKERTLVRHDSIGSGNNEETALWVTGYTTDCVRDEEYTIFWGTDTTSSHPFNIWNPNQSDDARYNAQRISTILIWEVVPSV